MTHSVTTAFLKPQKRLLKGREDTTGALDLASTEYNRPFMRYERLFSEGEVVWNIFDKSKVAYPTFTFQDHLDVVIRLLCEVAPDNEMIDLLSDRAF